MKPVQGDCKNEGSAKRQRHTKCPSVDTQPIKVWYVDMTEYYLAVKRNGVSIHGPDGPRKHNAE